MNAARSSPPVIEGFEYRDYLGGGGFADVFLYQQLRPKRQVAIKVLRNAVTDALTRQLFDAETDLMASVSHHPYIVSVFDASVADDGRPYIVMEYYPPPNYYQLAKQRSIPVAEVLRVGIQIASAVETAHRNGIIHRDIKPANILVDSYGRPGLTDFGISSGAGSEDDEAVGLSVPYAPPEIVSSQSNGNAQSDVYSLTATLYTLLTGRTPFERGERNGRAEVRDRVLNDAPPETGRSDIPKALEFLIRQGLSKRPGDRPQTALAFAHALRDIESSLKLDTTAIELQTSPDRSPDIAQTNQTDEAPATRAALRTIDPAPPSRPIDTPPPFVPRTERSQDHTPQHGTVLRDDISETGPAGDSRSMRPTDPVSNGSAKTAGDRSNDRTTSEPQPTAQPISKRTWQLAGAGAVAVGAVIALVTLVGGGEKESPKAPATTVKPKVIVDPGDPPDTPTDPVWTKVGTNTVSVSWKPGSDAKAGDKYRIFRASDESRRSLVTVDFPATTTNVTRPKGAELCIIAIRGDEPSDQHCEGEQ